MSTGLGIDWQDGFLTLVRGADFVCTIVAPDDWADDFAAELYLSGGDAEPVTWHAVIDGPRATFDVPAAEVGEVLDQQPRAMRLWYRRPSGGLLPWLRGPIHAH